MKSKNIFQSKKFAAFFFSVLAITANVWYVVDTPGLAIAVVGFCSLNSLLVGLLCLGFVLPQAKFDRAAAVLETRTDIGGPWFDDLVVKK